MKFKQQDCITHLHSLKKSNSGAGFTLIEMLIYISLVVIILLLATSFAWNIINSRTKSVAIQEVEQNGRFIMEKIIQATHQANDITLPAIGVTGANLELAMKDAGQDPIVFNLISGSLQMSQAGGPLINVSSENVIITNVQFSNLSLPNGKTSNVKVILNIEHINPNNRPEWEYVDTFETTIELRDR